MKININASGCGKGKTQAIIKMINQNPDEKFLIIVPSIKLANEYGDALNIQPITSEFSKNVQQDISRQIDLQNRILVITQKAFKDYKMKCMLCFRRNVIQDEEFNVMTTSKWKMDNHKDYQDMFVTKKLTETWYSVDIDIIRAGDFIESEDIFDDKSFLHDLLNTPQQIFTNTPTITDESYIISILSPQMYEGCQSLYIACANFTKTQQYHLWKSLFGIEFGVKTPFVPYEAEKVTIHYAEQKRNSKMYNTSKTNIRDEFIKYVNEQSTDVIYVDNNNNPDINNWTRLTHNCHGENKYREKAHIAVLSAINYNGVVTNFFTEVVGITADALRFALIGELAHQVIMRGSLRINNKARCDIYLMEQELAMYIYSLFTQADIKEIPNTSRETKNLSRSAIQKASEIRRNHKEVRHMDTEQLMKHDIWNKTNARGLYTRKAIADMKEQLKQMN